MIRPPSLRCFSAASVVANVPRTLMSITRLSSSRDASPNGFGIAAKQVRRKADLIPALQEMIAHDGPYVLDVLVPYQEHVLPMIPAGGTVREIIKS